MIGGRSESADILTGRVLRKQHGGPEWAAVLISPPITSRGSDLTSDTGSLWRCALAEYVDSQLNPQNLRVRARGRQYLEGVREEFEVGALNS